MYGVKLFFNWTAKITAVEADKPNSILGYNIAFDFLAWSTTSLIIIGAFIMYFFKDNELAVLIMGISIGSVLTRTPSFKEKDKK